MQPYGGLVVIISYAGNSAQDEDFLITQSNINITTQASENILVQSDI
jgi:hypothetical protein